MRVVNHYTTRTATKDKQILLVMTLVRDLGCLGDVLVDLLK